MRFDARDPMPRIPLNKSSLGADEIAAAKAVLDSDQLTMGEQCRTFEREFARYLGVKHAVMVNSGSSANLLALFALANPLVPAGDDMPKRILPGSEVIVPEEPDDDPGADGRDHRPSPPSDRR